VDPLVRKLRAGIRGKVHESPLEREPYATDESVFRIVPRVAVCPFDEEDVRVAVQIASAERVPVSARGGGTSVAGQAIGPGIVLDFSKQMNRVLDVSSESAVVQPGVVLEDLNRQLAERGRRFAPDPASRAWCTIGGMAGNNASGPHALRYGDTRRHLIRMRVVLADGSVASSDGLAMRFSPLAEETRRSAAAIRAAVRDVSKSSSGYHLAALLADPPDFTGLLVGSEGTLALATELTLRTIPLPERTSTAVFAFGSMDAALRAVPDLRKGSPLAIELIDRHIVEALGGEAGLADAVASLWVEWEGAPPAEASEPVRIETDPMRQAQLWSLRSKASKALKERPGSRRPLRVIEDGIVPAPRLVEYVAELREILLRHDCDGAIFGHAGDAHVHVNPGIDVGKPRLAERIEALMDEANALVLRLGGLPSGEHGDGLLRGRYFGDWAGPLIPLYGRVRDAFDPRRILNPGAKSPEGTAGVRGRLRRRFC
jgi:FAD/FMN-containing dehydrogenase